MTMAYDEYLTRVIDEGIEAARESYKDPKDALKLRGSIEGFEACRGKNPEQLAQLLSEARRTTLNARTDKEDDYWRTRCAELEIEWVCNCVSAVLYNEGLPVIITPTARGMMKAASIVGVGGAQA